MNLGRLSTYWGKYRKDQPALVYKGGVLKWGELDRQVDAVAAALQQLGVVKGDRVACLLNNCTEWAVAYLASMKVGAILVPLNARYGDDELREIEKQVSSRVVVSQPALVRKLGGAEFKGEADAGIHLYATQPRSALPWETVLQASGKPTAIELKPEDAAVICFTSGSTGLPKGVVHTHQGILGFAQSHITSLGWTSQEKVVMLAPFAFTGGIISTFTPAYVVGACTYIEEGFDPQRALQMLVGERITALAGVPIFWERMAACAGFAEADLSSLRSAVTGGAPVPSSLLQAYSSKGVSIRQSYGCTEGCGMLALPTTDDALSKPWSCGWPLASVDLQVVRDDGESCEIGEPGEILIRGIQVMKGYWNNPEADSKAWSNGWYHTGDMGVLDESGHLQIVDRKKSMIISGGVNVYPAEVERALAQIPGLAEVLVFGQPDAQWGERVVAVLYGPQLAEPVSLLKECRRLAGDYKAPREIIVSPKPLPRTSTGKLPRKDPGELYAGLAGCPRAVAGDDKRV